METTRRAWPAPSSDTGASQFHFQERLERHTMWMPEKFLGKLSKHPLHHSVSIGIVVHGKF